MIDAGLFARLMSSIQGKTHLVLIGDPHQLPPVEGGSFFADLVASNVVPTTRLNRQVRFENPLLVEISQAIMKAELEKLPIIDLVEDKNWLWQQVIDRFPHPTKTAPDQIEGENRFRILSALKMGFWGTEQLNLYFATMFRALGKPGEYFVAPIMIRKNDQITGLCNGETGWLVEKIGAESQSYALFKGGKKFFKSQLPIFEYSYVISIHKSQGSEYDEVLVLLPKGSEAFGLELPYTAVTRAKEKVLIAADRRTVFSMISRQCGKISGVCEKMRE